MLLRLLEAFKSVSEKEKIAATKELFEKEKVKDVNKKNREEREREKWFIRVTKKL